MSNNLKSKKKEQNISKSNYLYRSPIFHPQGRGGGGTTHDMLCPNPDMLECDLFFEI